MAKYFIEPQRETFSKCVDTVWKFGSGPFLLENSLLSQKCFSLDNCTENKKKKKERLVCRAPVNKIYFKRTCDRNSGFHISNMFSFQLKLRAGSFLVCSATCSSIEKVKILTHDPMETKDL